MLGRTHMAIGAAGIACLSPVLSADCFVPVKDFFHANGGHVPQWLVMEAVLVSAAVAGSLMPDLDQASSTMAHEIERLGQVVMFGLLVVLIFLLHQQTSWLVWLGAVFISWIFGTRNNVARLFGLAVVGAGMIELAVRHQVDMVGSILVLCWIFGTMCTGHRTFTHSVLGWGLLTVGLHIALSHMHHDEAVWKAAVIGVSVGYALHLVADAVAGGVPLLWPIKNRVGVRLIRTGSGYDHLIGTAALALFAIIAVFR